MKTVNANSVLGVMNLFNNEEYYKYAIEVLWILRSTAMKSIERNEKGGIYWDTKHPVVNCFHFSIRNSTYFGRCCF